MSIAFAFCGKIGTYKLQGRHARYADESLVRSSFASFRRHVYDTAIFKTKHVFIHSWNPEIESLVRILYAPHSALFEVTLHGFSNCGSGSDCFRVYSYLKSIRRVLNLVYQSSIRYNFIFLSRFDVLWRVPFRYDILPTDAYILPEHCSVRRRAPMNTTSSDTCKPVYVTSLEDSDCTDFLCRHNAYLRNHSALDMWIVGTHALMKTFQEIGTNATFLTLTKTITAHKPFWVTAHVYWGLFLRDKPVMHVNYKEWVDWSLARYPHNVQPWRPVPICHEITPVRRIVSKEKCREQYFCTNCPHHLV